MKTKATGLETKTITIHVSPEAASVYETASAEQQRKLDALLSLKLTEVTRAKRTLEVIMSEISHKAQERGLTPEILEPISDNELVLSTEELCLELDRREAPQDGQS